MIHRGAAVTHDAADAVLEFVGIVDLAGAVEADLLAIVSADLNLHFVAGFGFRATTDHVEHAARRRLTVHRGCRATQEGDALQVPGFHLRHHVGAFGQRQAVEELGGFETADLQPFGPAVAAVTAGDHARHVANGVVDVLYCAILHLLPGRDRDRARRFDQRGVGLGARCGATRGIALRRAPRAFETFLTALNAGGRQCHRPFRRSHQRVGARRGQVQLQAGATQRLPHRA